jgi:hypothetical protein
MSRNTGMLVSIAVVFAAVIFRPFDFLPLWVPVAVLVLCLAYGPTVARVRRVRSGTPWPWATAPVERAQ